MVIKQKSVLEVFCIILTVAKICQIIMKMFFMHNLFGLKQGTTNFELLQVQWFRKKQLDFVDVRLVKAIA